MNDKIAEEIMQQSTQMILRHIRSCQVIDLLNSKRKSIMFKRNNPNIQKDYSRHILMHLEPDVYKHDISQGNPNLYTNFNLILRSSSECKNFKRYIDSLQIKAQNNGEDSNYKEIKNLIIGNYLNVSDDEGLKIKQEFNISELFSFDNFSQEVKSVQKLSLFKNKNLESVNERATLKTNLSEFYIKHQERNLYSLGKEKIEIVLNCLNSKISLINGIQRCGKTSLTKELIKIFMKSQPNDRTLVICDSESQLDSLFNRFKNDGYIVDEGHRILRLGVKDVFIPVDKKMDIKQNKEPESNETIPKENQLSNFKRKYLIQRNREVGSCQDQHESL
jgi:hypothetical protein